MTKPLASTAPDIKLPRRQHIVVQGAVQGVGFRPFVFREATERGLTGWVENSPEGVIIQAEGNENSIAELVESMRQTPPVNAKIAEISSHEITPRDSTNFTIRTSTVSGAHSAQILPDIATCDTCLAELFDPGNRRFRYPFINCTQCGPRYSIIEDTPYDRARTSMRHFPMCEACLAEYEDPANRRFHAEPNACIDCGPRIALWDSAGDTLATDDEALAAAVAALNNGKIVAVKGIGGFHIFANARNAQTLNRLRVRKRREAKPFAVMFPDLDAVRKCAAMSNGAESLLTGPARPIVLLRHTGGSIAPLVAPECARIGVMLPYAPLHYLLMRVLGFPVVATSGNVTDEPIVTDETEALHRLAGIADLFLVHDRPIVRPVDDSVAQMVCGQPQVLRRARGYAPAPISLDGTPEGILAFGGHLKATLAAACGAGVVVSQHLGDLETLAAREAYQRAHEDVTQLHAARPQIAVRDLHPDYASSRAADASGLPVLMVQHHLAHVAACLAEHGYGPPALGVAWDGTGYGPDGTIWGGEFLQVTDSGWRRVAHLRPFRLPGGEVAAREPRRAALGMLYEAFDANALDMVELPPIADFKPSERDVLQTMLDRGVNAPVTSSMGRLFDAFAALCDLSQCISFEGQAAAKLEGSVGDRIVNRQYEFDVVNSTTESGSLMLDWEPALVALLADLRNGTDVGDISGALHNGLAVAIANIAERIGEPRVVLTGGCFQNVRLTETAVATLRSSGFEPVWHQRIPPNDGGISLGQAAWASWSKSMGEQPCV